MQTVTWAVSRPFGVLLYTALAEGSSPTAWHLNYDLLADVRMPPHWLLQHLISDWFRPVNL
ncbi:hypothetical protein LVY65_07745 [Sphingomonas sp. G124]|uniref:Uncharacterized protein n=1 Tax=Sphingomonas cremea TaxID=2904799 RepID=A0A9X1TYL4_9SPHN|nr:hypothetical protein [Sphingomonas cremea]MCF2514957.1 hypothetical protein [Sphingomonas cremea]